MQGKVLNDHGKFNRGVDHPQNLIFSRMQLRTNVVKKR